jgi:hypothetical protein
MAAQIGRFSKVALIRVLPDRGSCAVCSGRLCAITLQSGLRPDQTPIQYRRGTTRTGELDGAKEANGG